MSTIAKRGVSIARRSDRTEIFQYWVIYGICFGVFLVGALLERLTSWMWRAHGNDAQPRPSILEQASGAAGTCTTYAFMS